MTSAAETRWTPERRLAGLWRFAIAISIVNLLGHTLLGFEQPAAVPFVSLATAYGVELLLEAISAWGMGRPPRYRGGPKQFVEFLLSAHISALAVGMLLYANDQLWLVVFASALAIASKTILRVPVGPSGRHGARPTRHVLNPSNMAISLTLMLFPWVTAAPPYQFVENVTGAWDWFLTLLLFTSGTIVNTRFTGRVPLIVSWWVGFAAQGIARALLNGTPVAATLAPMTGIGFVLFSFYMITDPGTTPESRKAQSAFGLAVAALYGVIVQSHHIFGIYYSLTIVGLGRGCWLAYCATRLRHTPSAAVTGSTAAIAGTGNVAAS